MVIILGAGIAGLGASYHIGHNKCVLFEKNYYPGGHINTEYIDGFTWDEGPHISFTKYEYVRDLFAKSVDNKFLEYEVSIINYYKGNWIPHPAQLNMYAVPEPLRNLCYQDFITKRKDEPTRNPKNYKEWLIHAYGETFSQTFPESYTEKYWTTKAENLTTDWIGNRMYFPSINDVNQGLHGPPQRNNHYITQIRYPQLGGFNSFAKILEKSADIRFYHELCNISFKDRLLLFTNGQKIPYEKLIVTLPLPFVIQISDAPSEIKEKATYLNCSSLLLINIAVDHPIERVDNWVYIYDKDKYSTRINFTEKLSPNNAPPGKSGIQVEVYFSRYRPREDSVEHIIRKVSEELIEMGLIHATSSIDSINSKWVPWGNVIFDTYRKEALSDVLSWLEQHGLVTENTDLEPMTDWNNQKSIVSDSKNASVYLAGRYAQWKYFWTDDCILRGKFIGDHLNRRGST
jgi:protoporphyrinogen oxidase